MVLAKPQPTHPPIHIRKTVLREQVKIIKGAGDLKPNLATQSFFFGF